MITPTEQLNAWMQRLIENKTDQLTVTLTVHELRELVDYITTFVVNECIAVALRNDDPFTALDIGNSFGIDQEHIT